NGKHVTALLELKARFDEETNVGWARQMERSGVHVVFGFLDLKTHCKLALVVRKEGDGLQRYVHLSTGNYNSITSKLYTDVGLFTTDERIGTDASALFNLLTGYSQGHDWNHFIVAPTDLHRGTLELIQEQTRRALEGRPAWIFAKLNSLVDYRTIEVLYDASRAGVSIDLVVRGICCLRPGLPDVSENIRVRSVVDRFLEHSRIFVFGPADEDPDIYLSSADWMPRNFQRRVEAMFPVLSQDLKRRILEEIIPVYLEDNAKARLLQSDGTYISPPREPDAELHRSQEELIAIARATKRAERSGDSAPQTVVQHRDF
ncbi:MAG: RNA degradosome polyphosphate kinase, partial [Planctomycetales bacterium]